MIADQFAGRAARGPYKTLRRRHAHVAGWKPTWERGHPARGVRGLEARAPRLCAAGGRPQPLRSEQRRHSIGNWNWQLSTFPHWQH